MVEKFANPLAHAISMLLASGALWTALGAANEIENDGIVTQEGQKAIRQDVTEIRTDLKEQRAQQQEMRDILIRIETKLETE